MSYLPYHRHPQQSTFSEQKKLSIFSTAAALAAVPLYKGRRKRGVFTSESFCNYSDVWCSISDGVLDLRSELSCHGSSERGVWIMVEMPPNVRLRRSCTWLFFVCLESSWVPSAQLPQRNPAETTCYHRPAPSSVLILPFNAPQPSL